jgi:chaperonin GroES
MKGGAALLQHHGKISETKREEEPMSELKIRPLDDRVVVQPLEAEEKTAGGILLPDNAREKPQRGKVVAVGAGKLTDDGKRIPVSLAVGDEVVYGRYSGHEIEHGGLDLKIMRETDVLAKVTH